MKVVILDRDGVINQDSPDYIKSEDEWNPLTGSIEAIATLSKAGYKIAVATNQSGLDRGLFDEFALARMHQKLCTLVENAGGQVDGVFYCPHIPDAGCECRKPGVGLLKKIEEQFACSLSNQYFIGDSVKDLQAAVNFSCRPVLVRTGNGTYTEAQLSSTDIVCELVFADLAEAASYIVSND